MAYTRPLSEETCGDLMSVDDFIESCRKGFFIDYDGFGHPVKDGLLDQNIWVKPSKLNEIPEGVTHVMWYNR